MGRGFPGEPGRGCGRRPGAAPDHRVVEGT